MDTLFEFFSFNDPNVLIVTLGTFFLGAISATTGCFAFLRKRSLVGDAVAHAILPGIALAFMIGQEKNPLILIIGALISGWIALLSIDHISRNSKIKSDTAIGLVLSVFFGFGILLLTRIQHSGAGNQAGLDKFLFGKAASMSVQDVQTFAIVGLITLIILSSFYKEFKLISFNPDYASSVGLPVRTLEFFLSSLTVLAITTGIQSVGVVLMAALLITPAAAARSWTHRLGSMILLSALFGAFAGLTGTYISYTAPRMPTGPWVVMALSFFALFSLVFAPKRGVLSRIRQQRKNREKIITENILKAMYQIGETQGTQGEVVTEEVLQEKRSFLKREFSLGVRLLRKRLWIIESPEGWKLTTSGVTEASRVVRLHRLWEMYLNQKMNLQADHIHPNAETIEHIITPEIENELIRELDRPERDPHDREIPYTS